MPESNSTPPKPPADQNETPEDVATLYSWANLHGGKYRDFSASRAQAREEARLRVEEAMAAEQRRLEEEAAEIARQTDTDRLAEIARQAEAERHAVLAAQEAQRQAAQQRVWQPPPTESCQGDFSPSYSTGLPSLHQQPQPPNPAPSIAPDTTDDCITNSQTDPSSVSTTQQAVFDPQQYLGRDRSSTNPSQPPTPQPQRTPAYPSALSPYRDYPTSQSPTHPQDTQYVPQYAPSRWQQPEHLGPVDDAPLGSRGSIANRWFALKSVFDPHSTPVEQATSHPPVRVPVLAVFSLAGGVGKTSLVASLARALSSRGERVLLVDTAAYGLLPFFFGARDQRPGTLRTFNPPGVSAEAPIQLVTLDPEGHGPEFQNPYPNQNPNQSRNPETNHDWLTQEVARYTGDANRVLIDLPTASGSTTRRVLRLSPVILVPVLPDMNSVVSVGAIESFFRHSSGANAGSKPIMPYYVLNQFDYSLPLHLDVREILREQIGDRLLPFALRRSPAISEALAEGMTVMDYAPNAVVTEDYVNLAGWVRSLSAPATQRNPGVRWIER